MERPTKMTGPNGLSGNVAYDHAKNVVYGAAGQVTSMPYLQWQDSNDNNAPYYFTESKTDQFPARVVTEILA